MGSSSACCHCGKDSVNADYYQSFGMCICNQCKAYEPVISKTNAKSQYLLSDTDLTQLGCIQKGNPQHKEWAPMKMYLVSQVESVAVAKHGSLDDVSQKKQQKVKDKIEGRAKSRKLAEQSALSEGSGHEKLTAVLHKYSDEQPDQEEQFIDAADGKRKRRFGPGLAAADVEEI